MHLPSKKTFLFLFCALAIFSQTVSAQTKYLERSSENGQNSSALENKRLISQSFSNPFQAGHANDQVSHEPENEFKRGIKNFRYNFLENKAVDLKESEKNAPEKVSEQKPLPFPDYVDDEKDKHDAAKSESFNWRGAVNQSLIFLGVQHGYAILGQEKTREALTGKFWKDYADSVKSLHGWDDGGRFFTNYLAHPMQGAFNGQIYVQNSPQARREQFSMTEKYWKTRMKAMLWTAAWSTQFEVGPISQASIGNVGLKGKQTWEDIVVTPTVGTAWLVGEDFFDRFVVKNIERRTNNFYIRIFARMLFNPTRNFSNILRFKEPWYRDRLTEH